jgi:hypothetical protein
MLDAKQLLRPAPHLENVGSCVCAICDPRLLSLPLSTHTCMSLLDLIRAASLHTTEQVSTCGAPVGWGCIAACLSAAHALVGLRQQRLHQLKIDDRLRKSWWPIEVSQLMSLAALSPACFRGSRLNTSSVAYQHAIG